MIQDALTEIECSDGDVWYCSDVIAGAAALMQLFYLFRMHGIRFYDCIINKQTAAVAVSIGG